MDSSSSSTICMISSNYEGDEGRWRDGGRLKIGGSAAPSALALDAQLVCLAVLRHQQLDPLCTSTCCANTQRAPFNKELNRHSAPLSSPPPSPVLPLGCYLAHINEMREGRRASERRTPSDCPYLHSVSV